MTMIAMSGSAALMREASFRMPTAVFERDFNGMNPFDLFCERCCASHDVSPACALAAHEIGSRASDIALLSAIGSGLIGLETARELSRHDGSASSVIAVLRSLLLARELGRDTPGGSASGQGSRRL